MKISFLYKLCYLVNICFVANTIEIFHDFLGFFHFLNFIPPSVCFNLSFLIILFNFLCILSFHMILASIIVEKKKTCWRPQMFKTYSLLEACLGALCIVLVTPIFRLAKVKFSAGNSELNQFVRKMSHWKMCDVL